MKPSAFTEFSDRKNSHFLRLLLFVFASAVLAACGDDNNSPSAPREELPPIDIAALDLKFVWVEAGEFTMGSPAAEEGRKDDEGPQHQVTLEKGFWIGQFELTQAQWEKAMGTRPWEGQDFVQSHPDHPAVYISWQDTQALIQRLNEAADAPIYTMPTEAEWEYACRAGTQTAWTFGDQVDQLDEYAWYEGNAWSADLQYAQAVGSKAPNAWGLYDCYGNVWEWVFDYYGPYEGVDRINPIGPTSGSFRVIRGGSFFYFSQDTRSATRYYDQPSQGDSNVGVRLVRFEIE